MYEKITAVVNRTDMIIHNTVIPLAILVVVVVVVVTCTYDVIEIQISGVRIRLMTMSPLYPCGKPCSRGTRNETVKNLALISSIINRIMMESQLRITIPWECFQFFNRIENSITLLTQFLHLMVYPTNFMPFLFGNFSRLSTFSMFYNLVFYN